MVNLLESKRINSLFTNLILLYFIKYWRYNVHIIFIIVRYGWQCTFLAARKTIYTQADVQIGPLVTSERTPSINLTLSISNSRRLHINNIVNISVTCLNVNYSFYYTRLSYRTLHNTHTHTHAHMSKQVLFITQLISVH